MAASILGMLAHMSDHNDKIIAEFRANEGRTEMFGDALVLLHTTGRRSGGEHVTPVVSRAEGDRLYVFGSAAGADDDPAWVQNLRAEPQVVFERGTETFPARATELGREERDEVWERQKVDAPGFADYEAKTSRVIPVIELDTN